MASSTDFPCLDDATVLDGLAALRRSAPANWHMVMRRAARQVGPDATVAEVLRAGGMGALVPQGCTDRDATSLRKPRDCARRLIEAYGDVVLADIDDAWLQRERLRAPKNRHLKRLSRGRAGACFTQLRQMVHAVQREAGTSAVTAKLPAQSRPPIGDRRGRELAPWPDLKRLIEEGPPRIQAALILQLHVAARPGRVLALTVGDVNLTAGAVTVRVRSRAGGTSTLRYPLTQRAVAGIRPWHEMRLEEAGDGGLLFPMRGEPKRPTPSLRRAIRRAAAEQGCAPVTMAAVRLRAQAGLRSAMAPRGMVRGTGGVALALQVAHQPNSESDWGQSYSGPSDGAPPEYVPLRAPPQCQPHEPEVGRGRERRGGLQSLAPPPQLRGAAGMTPTPVDEKPNTETASPEYEELARLMSQLPVPPQTTRVPPPVASTLSPPERHVTHALAFALGLTTQELLHVVLGLVKPKAGQTSGTDSAKRLAVAKGAPMKAPIDPAEPPASVPDPWGWGDGGSRAGGSNHDLRPVNLLEGLRLSMSMR
jgi:hypothetical protein